MFDYERERKSNIEIKFFLEKILEFLINIVYGFLYHLFSWARSVVKFFLKTISTLSGIMAVILTILILVFNNFPEIRNLLNNFLPKIPIPQNYRWHFIGSLFIISFATHVIHFYYDKLLVSLAKKLKLREREIM